LDNPAFIMVSVSNIGGIAGEDAGRCPETARCDRKGFGISKTRRERAGRLPAYHPLLPRFHSPGSIA
jgi:hypothetical protein